MAMFYVVFHIYIYSISGFELSESESAGKTVKC